MKGRYDHAVQSVEPLNWEVNARNQFTVTLHAEGLDAAKGLDTSELSVSGLGLSGTSQAALQSGGSSSVSVATPANVASEFGPTQQLIISTLNISPSLLDHNRCDLRFAFAQYEALQDTTKKLNKLAADGTWKQKVHNF